MPFTTADLASTYEATVTNPNNIVAVYHVIFTGDHHVICHAGSCPGDARGGGLYCTDTQLFPLLQLHEPRLLSLPTLREPHGQV